MKPQQLADLLNVTPATIRRWALDEYTEFLSPKAQGGQGLHRSFDQHDARVLAWIAHMRAENMPVDNIMMTLKAAKADNWNNLPPLPGGMANDEPVALMPREAAEERLRALTERYETQLHTIITERDQLRLRLEGEQGRNLELQKRVNELTEKEAELRGILQQYYIGGKRLNVGVIIAAVAVVAVVITVVIFTLATVIR